MMTLRTFLKEWVPCIAAVINSESCYCDHVGDEISSLDPELGRLMREHKEAGERIKRHIKTVYDIHRICQP